MSQPSGSMYQKVEVQEFLRSLEGTFLRGHQEGGGRDWSRAVGLAPLPPSLQFEQLYFHQVYVSGFEYDQV